MKRRQFLAAIAATGVTAAAIATLPKRAVTQTTTSRTSKATPFKISVPQAKLNQIRQRVQAYKWYKAPTVGGWKYGADQNYMKQLTAYWVDKYDWRKHEREMNRFNHFTANVDDRTLHFIYEKGSGRNSQPLLLLHGWPYSFYSFNGIIEPLAHPERFGGSAEDGFDVIVPSLPGFVFSEAPKNPTNLRQLGGSLHRLMTDILGYDSYVVQGGDFGAVIADWLALDYTPSIKGIHANMPAFRHAGSEFGSGETGPGSASAEERAFVKREKENFMRESAYFMLQATRPETLSVAIMDSPVGQAAWIAEKFYFWTDKRQRAFEEIVPMDHLLTEVMLYLVTDSFSTSIWPYAAFADEPFTIPAGRRIEVPYALAAFPDPLTPVPPRSLAARSRSRIVQWTEMPRGGHFPFLEEPQLFLEDVRKFGRLMRIAEGNN